VITIRTNIVDVVSRLTTKIAALKDKERIMRSCAIQMTGELRYRIHVAGEDASGKPIGTYTTAYLRLRQKKFNRTPDPKIILSLTSQQENDMGPIETPNGYGIGFKNITNLEKAGYAEDRAGGSETENKIYSLSEAEQNKTSLLIQSEVTQIFSE
jgi:hypothetical protein